jgi:hypothetical protein
MTEVVFVGHASGAPRRRIFIYSEPLLDRPDLGWMIVVEEIGPSGAGQCIFDTFELTFSNILRYPEDWATGPITWVREDTGEPVDIEDFRSELAPAADLPV